MAPKRSIQQATANVVRQVLLPSSAVPPPITSNKRPFRLRRRRDDDDNEDADSGSPCSSAAAPLPFSQLLSQPTPPLCPRTVPVALAYLKSADPRLAPLIDAHGSRCCERLGQRGGGRQQEKSPPPTFPRLVQTILAQQLSWKAASTIHKRLLVEFGVLIDERPGKSSSSGSSISAAAYGAAALRLTPQTLLAADEARVRSAGVSGAKASALKDLAQRYADGRLSDEMLHAAAEASPAGLNQAAAEVASASAAASRATAFSSASSCSSSSSCLGATAATALLAVRGVGPWTLDMVSMFVLGAPDVLPAGDLGVRKGLARLRAGGGGSGGGGRGGGAGALPDAAAAERLTAAWRPYRTVGAWLMWRLAEEQQQQQTKKSQKKQGG